MIKIESIIDRQLKAYNEHDFNTFKSCYHENIKSYDVYTLKLNPKMSGQQFFDYYRLKFSKNPSLYCNVTDRMVHGDLVIDKEVITGYHAHPHTELVIYQLKDQKIIKMWFSKEILMQKD